MAWWVHPRIRQSGEWADCVIQIPLTYHTVSQSSEGLTPFFLTHGHGAHVSLVAFWYHGNEPHLIFLTVSSLSGVKVGSTPDESPVYRRALFVGSAPCLRVLWQCYEGILAPSATSRRPSMFVCTGDQTENPPLLSPVPNRLSYHRHLNILAGDLISYLKMLMISFGGNTSLLYFGEQLSWQENCPVSNYCNERVHPISVIRGCVSRVLNLCMCNVPIMFN